MFKSKNALRRRYIERYKFTLEMYFKTKDKDREAEIEGKLSEQEYVLECLLNVKPKTIIKASQEIIDKYTNTEIFRGFTE